MDAQGLCPTSPLIQLLTAFLCQQIEDRDAIISKLKKDAERLKKEAGDKASVRLNFSFPIRLCHAEITLPPFYPYVKQGIRVYPT